MPTNTHFAAAARTLLTAVAAAGLTLSHSVGYSTTVKAHDLEVLVGQTRCTVVGDDGKPAFYLTFEDAHSLLVG